MTMVSKIFSQIDNVIFGLGMKNRYFLLLCCLVTSLMINAQVFDKLKPIKEKKRGDLSVVEKKGLYGYQNEKGKILVKCVFEEARDFKQGYAIVKSGGKYGMISNAGVYSIFPQYDSMSEIRDNRVITRLGNLYGFSSPDELTKVEPQYKSIDGFKNGTTWVTKKSGLSNVVDTLNQSILEDDIELLKFVDKNNLKTFRSNDKIGLVSIKDKCVIFKAKYSKIKAIDDAKTIFCLIDYGMGEIRDVSQKVYLPKDYNAEFVELSNNVFAQFNKKDSKSTLFFLDTQEVKEYNCNIRKNEKQIVKNSLNKFGVIDKYYREILQCKYDTIGTFKDGMCVICQDSLIGYVDEQYNVVIEPKYKTGTDFYNGKAIVKTTDEEHLLIDKQGNIIPDPIKYPRYLAALIKGNYHKSAVVDVSNKEIRLIVDNDIHLYDDNSFKFSLNYYFAGTAITGNNLYFPGAYSAITSFFTGVYQTVNGKLCLYATDKEKVKWIDKGNNDVFSKILNSDLLDEIESIAHIYYLNFQPNPQDTAYIKLKSTYSLEASAYRQANISSKEDTGITVEDGKISFGPDSNASNYSYFDQIKAFKAKVYKSLRDYAPNIISAVSCTNESVNLKASIEQIISSKSIKTQTNEYLLSDAKVEDTKNKIMKIANEAAEKYPNPQTVALSSAQEDNNKKIAPSEVPQDESQKVTNRKGSPSKKGKKKR